MITPTTSRKRPIALGNAPAPAKAQPTKFMKEVAASVYTHNKAMNAEKSAHDRDRKALYSDMVKEGIMSFEMKAMDDVKGTIVLEVVVATPETDAMDVRKLYELLGCPVPTTQAGKAALESFLNTVTATKGNVERLHSKAMATRIAYVQQGTENVSVKAKG